MKTFIKIKVNNLNLHESRNEVLGNYTGGSEMVGGNLFVEHKRSTDMRFENVEAYEIYFSNIDLDFDADDGIFTG